MALQGLKMGLRVESLHCTLKLFLIMWLGNVCSCLCTFKSRGILTRVQKHWHHTLDINGLWRDITKYGNAEVMVSFWVQVFRIYSCLSPIAQLIAHQDANRSSTIRITSVKFSAFWQWSLKISLCDSFLLIKLWFKERKLCAFVSGRPT